MGSFVTARTLMDAIREAAPEISIDLAADITADMDELDGERDGSIPVTTYGQDDESRLCRMVSDRMASDSIEGSRKAAVQTAIVRLLMDRTIPPRPSDVDASEVLTEPELVKAGFDAEAMLHLLKTASQSPFIDAGFRTEILRTYERMREIFPEIPKDHAWQGQGEFYQRLGNAKISDRNVYSDMNAHFRTTVQLTTDLLNHFKRCEREGQGLTEVEKVSFRNLAGHLDVLHRFARPAQASSPGLQMAWTAAANAQELQKGAANVNTFSSRLGPYGKPLALVGAGLLVGAAVMYGIMKLTKD